MTTVDTTTLRALAAQATPGPWAYQGEGVEVYGASRDAILTGDFRVIGQMYAERDREFVTHCNPSVVLALLDRLAQVEGKLAKYGRHLDSCIASDGTDCYCKWSQTYRHIDATREGR